MWQKAVRRLQPAGVLALVWVALYLSGTAAAESVTDADFMPHGVCYQWNTTIVLLHVISDGLITLSYFCIPVALIYLVRKRGDLPFNWIFFMFGGFIVSCGITHVMEIWTIWHATYLLAGVFKAVTAGLSVLTAVMMIPLIPRALAIPSPAHLQEKNRDLQLAIIERELTEEQLRRTLHEREVVLAELADRQAAVEELQLVQEALHESQDRLNAIIHSAMDGIITVDEDQCVLIFNSAAEKMFGYQATEVVGSPMERFLPLRFRSGHRGHVRTFSETGTSSRAMGSLGAIWGLRANGQEFPIEASISQVVTGGKRFFTVILRDITERRRVEQERGRLAAVVESSEDAIIAKDLHGMITAWNRGAEKAFGYSAAEMVGQPTLKLFPPERVQEEIDILGRISRGQSVEHYETVRVRKDGSRIDVSVTISPIRDSRGTIVGASKITRDISAAKLVEDALRESQERFLAMANGIPQLAWMAEADGHIFWYNQRWYDYTGTNFEQMQGWGWQCVHDPLVLPSVMERWTESLASGTPFDMEFPIRGADGQFLTFLTRVLPVRDAEGKVVRWFGTNTDISERKQSEERLAHVAEQLVRSQHALEGQKHMLQSVLDSMDEGLVAVDENGKFQIWNAAAERIVGYGPAELGIPEWAEFYGNYLPDGVTLVPAEQNPLARAIRGEACTEELVLRNPRVSGNVWIEVTGSPVRDHDGVARGGVVAFRDITSRKATEREIEKLNGDLQQRVADLARSNQELEQFAYVASHDLQEPLRMVASYTQLLTERYRGKLDEAADKFLGYAGEGALRMQVMIHDLLAFSRVGRVSGEKEVVNLRGVLEDARQNLAAAIEESGALVTSGELPPLWAEHSLITQLLQNLIGNAIKFRGKARPEVSVSAQQSNGEWTFSVQDNGIGIARNTGKTFSSCSKGCTRARITPATGLVWPSAKRLLNCTAAKSGSRARWEKAPRFTSLCLRQHGQKLLHRRNNCTGPCARHPYENLSPSRQ